MHQTIQTSGNVIDGVSRWIRWIAWWARWKSMGSSRKNRCFVRKSGCFVMMISGETWDNCWSQRNYVNTGIWGIRVCLPGVRKGNNVVPPSSTSGNCVVHQIQSAHRLIRNSHNWCAGHRHVRLTGTWHTWASRVGVGRWQRDACRVRGCHLVHPAEKQTDRHACACLGPKSADPVLDWQLWCRGHSQWARLCHVVCSWTAVGSGHAHAYRGCGHHCWEVCRHVNWWAWALAWTSGNGPEVSQKESVACVHMLSCDCIIWSAVSVGNSFDSIDCDVHEKITTFTHLITKKESCTFRRNCL